MGPSDYHDDFSAVAAASVDEGGGPAPLEPLAPLPSAGVVLSSHSGAAAAALGAHRSASRGGKGGGGAAKTLEEKAWIDFSLSVSVFARDATTLEVSAEPAECAR